MNGEPTQPLVSLAEGASGRIASVQVDDADLQRLEVMGLCAGRSVAVVQQGNPMIVRVLGTRIGLSAMLARHIGVKPHEAPAAEPVAAPVETSSSDPAWV